MDASGVQLGGEILLSPSRVSPESNRREQVQRGNSGNSNSRRELTEEERAAAITRGVRLRYAIVAITIFITCIVLYCSNHHTRWLLLQYGNIPVIAAIVGWGTNKLAIQMTFYPLEYVGCCSRAKICGMPLCGWQGIIPSNCERMAEQAVELMLDKLKVGRNIASIDSQQLIQELRPALEDMVPKIVNDVGPRFWPGTWNSLPEKVQQEIRNKCIEDSKQAITKMSQKSREDQVQGETQEPQELFKLRELLIDLLSRDKQLVNDIFEKCAEKEFIFIRVSGGYLGFLFGVVQMVIWAYCNRWWTLPLFGFVVGYLTNWVALKIIFQPVEPTQILGFTFQGLFIARKAEVASVYADLLSRKVLNAETLLRGIMEGDQAESLFKTLDESIQKGIDESQQGGGLSLKDVASWTLKKFVWGEDKWNKVKKRVSYICQQEVKSDQFIKGITPYIDRTLKVHETVKQSMQNMADQEFADMLLPVFKEGEMKLVLIGGILGVIVGMLQAIVQVPDQLGI